MGPRKKPAIVFNEISRKEFLTGFHKRKLERKKKAQLKFEEQLKEAKKLIKAKARETFQKYLTDYKPLDNSSIYEDQYELPHHSVKVQEILDEDIVKENGWIGPNRGSFHMEENLHPEETYAENCLKNEHDRIPLSSIKEIKKMIGQQSRDLMQCNRAFQKKNRIEKMKSKKKAARKRRHLEKEKKKLKGRKRK